MCNYDTSVNNLQVKDTCRIFRKVPLPFDPTSQSKIFRGKGNIEKDTLKVTSYLNNSLIKSPTIVFTSSTQHTPQKQTNNDKNKTKTTTNSFDNRKS